MLFRLGRPCIQWHLCGALLEQLEAVLECIDILRSFLAMRAPHDAQALLPRKFIPKLSKDMKTRLSIRQDTNKSEDKDLDDSEEISV